MLELEAILNQFCKRSVSKEEACLKGLLMGLGTHLPCPMPNWELMKKYPYSIDIEREMRELFEKIHRKDIKDAEELLAKCKKGG